MRTIPGEKDDRERSGAPPGTRETAFRILWECENRKTPLKTLLAEEPGSLGEARDRRLVHELVLGTLRFRSRLEYLISSASGVPAARIEKKLRVLLGLGAYQLIRMSRIPEYAAVNEIVALARKLAGGRRAAGFANAVLRKIAASGKDIKLPDAEKDPEGYLAVTLGHPRWLARKWVKRLGFEETASLEEANNERPPCFFFPNPLHPDASSLFLESRARADDDNGLVYEPFPTVPGCLKADRSLGASAAAREGLIQIQDAASRLVCLLLGAVAGERVLDACSAPGGKSAALAALMDNKGLIVAADSSFPRLAEAAKSFRRLRVENAAPVLTDFAAGPPFLGTFDRILLDAPCTGTGTLRRNPDIKWNLTAAALARAARIQKKLLRSVSQSLKAGGVLVYSTCSLEEEENENVVRDFISGNADFVHEPLERFLSMEARDFSFFKPFATPDGFLRSYPHRHGMDGFFAAVLRRIAA